MSKAVTLAGYAVLAAAVGGYQVLGLLRRRTPTLGKALAPVRASRTGRLILLAGWLWIGWHIFVRGNWA